MKHARLVFGVLTGLCLVTVIFHLVAIAESSGDAPRHALFAALNVALAAALWARPRWLVWPLGALVVQQLWSHGHDLASACARGEIDWVSIGVLVVMPLMLVLVWHDRRLT